MEEYNNNRVRCIWLLVESVDVLCEHLKIVFVKDSGINSVFYDC